VERVNTRVPNKPRVKAARRYCSVMLGKERLSLDPEEHQEAEISNLSWRGFELSFDLPMCPLDGVPVSGAPLHPRPTRRQEHSPVHRAVVSVRPRTVRAGTRVLLVCYGQIGTLRLSKGTSAFVVQPAHAARQLRGHDGHLGLLQQSPKADSTSHVAGAAAWQIEGTIPLNIAAS
jgi:hypothetical protein